MHLRRAGFRQIRPLLGGITAWTAAGYPVERALIDASSPAAPVAATVPAK